MSRIATMFAAGFLAVTATAASAATVTLGSYSFDSNLFGDTLAESDGGTFSSTNWLNVVNANPGNPGFLTGANFNTGIANIGLGSPDPSYTIGYSTPISNGAGADIGVVTARYSTSDTITLTINGLTLNFGPSAATLEGGAISYFYNGSAAGSPDLYVTAIDLSDFGVAPGGTISSVIVTGSPELDLIRVAGIERDGTGVPVPATLPLVGAGLVVLGLARRKRA